MSKRYYVTEQQLHKLRTQIVMIKAMSELLPVQECCGDINSILANIEAQIMAYRPGIARLDKMPKERAGEKGKSNSGQHDDL